MSHNEDTPLYTCHCNKVFTSLRGLSGHKRMHGKSDGKITQLMCSCIFTKKEIPVQYLEKYQKTIKQCIHCEALFKPSESSQKLCSHSCNASYNNKLRPPKSAETKAKISASLRKNYKTIEVKNKKSKKIKPEIVGEFCKLFSCKCAHCRIEFTNRKKIKYCQLCASHYSESNKVGYKFKFNVYHYPQLFDLELLKEVGWFAPRGKSGSWNIDGLSRDHRVSVHESISNQYDPYYISHPLNCELMPHSNNNKKKTKSSITYEELVNQVIEFDNKNRNL
jgi:hypothetical protein